MADADALAQRLGIVARGSIGLRSDDGDASASVKAPDWFGAGVQPAAALAGCAAVAETAALCGLSSAADDLAALTDAHPALQLFVEPPAPARTPSEAADPHMNLMKTPVRRLLKRAPVTVSPHSPDPRRRRADARPARLVGAAGRARPPVRPGD